MTATPIVAIRSTTERRLKSRPASQPPATTATAKNMKVVVREPISLAPDDMFESTASGYVAAIAAGKYRSLPPRMLFFQTAAYREIMMMRQVKTAAAKMRIDSQSG